MGGVDHRQPKLNIREPLNYKDLYGNATDLCKMVETNTVMSTKSTYPAASCILFHCQFFKPIRSDSGELGSFEC